MPPPALVLSVVRWLNTYTYILHMKRLLCYYCGDAVNEWMLIAAITPARRTRKNSFGSHFYPPFFWAGEEAKIKKWWSKTVYANLISHASYVLPRFLWRQAAKIAGQVTSQRLNMSDFLCNDNAIEHTVCSSHKRGHINKKRFGVKVETIGTTFS